MPEKQFALALLTRLNRGIANLQADQTKSQDEVFESIRSKLTRQLGEHD